MESASAAPTDDVRALIDKSASQLVEQANDGLRRISDTLRNKNLDEIVREAESFARRQPVVFLGAAAVAGFLAVRFLKASSQGEGSTQAGFRS